jgi:hypothetical protein
LLLANSALYAHAVLQCARQSTTNLVAASRYSPLALVPADATRMQGAIRGEVERISLRPAFAHSFLASKYHPD